jgi:hypothetical protein
MSSGVHTSNLSLSAFTLKTSSSCGFYHVSRLRLGPQSMAPSEAGPAILVCAAVTRHSKFSAPSATIVFQAYCYQNCVCCYKRRVLKYLPLYKGTAYIHGLKTKPLISSDEICQPHFAFYDKKRPTQSWQRFEANQWPPGPVRLKRVEAGAFPG